MQKTIFNIQFKTLLCEDELMKIFEEGRQMIARTKGLCIKYYHINNEKNLVGSTYIFDDEDQARNYLNSFMMDGVGVRYGIVPESLQVDFVAIVMEACGDRLFN